MKVVKVLYQKVFPLGMYVNEKIGVEIELNSSTEQESSFDAYRRAKDLVEAWHREGNPSLNLPSSIQSELPVIQKSAEEEYVPGISVNDILSCGSLVVLDAYKGIIRDNKVLMQHYNTRREQLVNESK